MSETNPSSNVVPDTGVKKNLGMAILSYIGILVIIPFIVAKNDPFVKFHIKQGLVLVEIWIAVWILGMFIPTSVWQVLQLVNLVVLIFSIIGIVNAVKGQEKELPLIGHFAKYFTF